MRGAFGSCVRGSGVKRGGFGLWRGSGSEHLRGSSLVILDVAPTRGHDVGSDGFQQPEGSAGHHVGGVIGDFEGDGHVGLCGQIVDLVGSDGVEPATKRGSVGEVGVMELHPGLVGVVGVDVDVVDALRIEVRGAADQAVDLVPFVEEELGQVRSVLTSDTGDQRNLPV
ncbi:hypothetical protein GQ457_09G009760 [Hibiscus cannabinus]